MSCFDKVDKLATHALVCYIRGLTSDLKFRLAYFATKGASAYQIMPKFLEATAILEFSCKVRTIATVSDGAPPSRTFYRIHGALSGFTDDKVGYCRQNIFAPNRFIWFFDDLSHLMKTTRNSIHHAQRNLYISLNIGDTGK